MRDLSTQELGFVYGAGEGVGEVLAARTSPFARAIATGWPSSVACQLGSKRSFSTSSVGPSGAWTTTRTRCGSA